MRASGILLPVSSLPSKYGIGCFSAEAYEFVDQLVKAGQKYWQILPLGPTGYGDSPYQSFSTFAGNPYFIDLETFVKAGYLEESDCENCDWGGSESYVDYEKIYNSRFRLLRKAFENYDCEGDPAYQKFVEENAAWLEDYSLYMAIKDSLNGVSWIEWPKELKNREKDALAEAGEKLAKEEAFYCFQQYWFFKQWTELKTYANEKGVEMYRSTLHLTAQTHGHSRNCSSLLRIICRLVLPDAHRMLFPLPGSSGEIRFMTGSTIRRQAMHGGHIGWPIV